jgi:putative FmdB family regulatory protein
VPVYAYDCGACGEFELRRPFAEAGAAGLCPGCGAEGRRVYTPPAVARLARPLRRALDMEERSAHEPAVVGEKRGARMPHVHRGHGCC